MSWIRKSIIILFFIVAFYPYLSFADAPPPGVCVNVNPPNQPDDKGDKTKEPVVLSNGNMTLSYEDFSVKSLGPSLELVRTYNAQQSSRVPGWSAEAGSWSIQDDTLVGKGDRFVTNAVYSDLVFEVDMRTEFAGVQNFHAGWVNFRYNSITDFYYFLIRRDGFLELTKVSGGITTQILFQASGLSPFDWHRIRVEFIGNNLKLFVDGIQKINYFDPSPIASGRIGLNSYFSQVRYENLEIQLPETILYGFNGPSEAESTMFGYGWISTYELHLDFLTDGDAIVHHGTGVPDRYDWDGFSFTAPKLVYETLTKIGAEFELKDKEASVFHFDAAGKLRFIRDRNGNRLTLTYTGAQLTSVTDAVNRTLQFIYGANGKVEFLIDPLSRRTHYLYNPHKDLIEAVSPGNRHIVFTYDGRHTMQTATDRENHLYQFHYFYNERISRQIDPLGSVTFFFYFWDYTDVTNNRGERYHYAFINNWLTESVLDPEGYTTSYDYDGNWNRNKIIDRNGQVTDLIYDQKGNITSETRYLGDGTPVTRTAVYDLNWNQPEQTVDEEGRVTDYVYDNANGNLLTTTKYLEGVPVVTQFQYNPRGQLIKRTEPNNTFTEFEYDVWGNVNLIKEPLLRETSFTYDAAGRLLTVTDPNDHITQFLPDDADNITKIIYPDLTEVKMAYDKNKDLLTFTDELNHVTAFAYDVVRNRTSVTDPLLKVTSFTYDSVNFMHLDKKSLLSITDPNLRVAQFTYDKLDRLKISKDPLNFETSYTRDGEGNLLTLTNARNFSHTFTFDSLNRVTEEKDPLNYVTAYSYDKVGNVTSRRDASGRLATYTYDDLNRLTRINYPDSSFIAYSYDLLGNRLSMTDATGLTSYTYDDLNRLKTVIFPNNDVITYDYDPAGNRTSMISRAGTRMYTYDERDRLLTVNDSVQGLTTLEYDDTGRRKKLLYANGLSADYSYNDRGDLLSITYKNSSLQTLFSITYTYDNTGNIKTMTDDTGMTQYFYDNTDQLKEVRYPGGSIVTYTYDPVGNRITMVDSEGSHSYTYDAADRLLMNEGITYSYDNSGNMVSENHPIEGLTTYAYDFEHRLKAVFKSATEYSTHLYPGWNLFSLPGEPVNQNISTILGGLTLGTDYDQVSRFNIETGSYAHYNGIDKFNQFTTLEYGKGYQIYITNPNGVDITLNNLTHPDKLLALRQGWNLLGTPSDAPIPLEEALNNLILGSDYDYVSGWNTELNAYEYPSNLDPSKSYWLYAYQDNSWQIHSNTNAYATYTYNGDGERIAKYTPKNEIHYYHDGSNTLYETDAGSNITVSYTHTLSIDDLISERKLGETQFRLNDHLGSLRKTANQSQSITASITYDAFGKPNTASSSRFLFTGRELDPETNLYYYRARTYQPSLGRFTSKDPIIFLAGVNFYNYVWNNPIYWVDPFGLEGALKNNKEKNKNEGEKLGEGLLKKDSGKGGRTNSPPGWKPLPGPKPGSPGTKPRKPDPGGPPKPANPGSKGQPPVPVPPEWGESKWKPVIDGLGDLLGEIFDI